MCARVTRTSSVPVRRASSLVKADRSATIRADRVAPALNPVRSPVRADRTWIVEKGAINGQYKQPGLCIDG